MHIELRLERLPKSIGGLSQLTHVDVNDCTSLETSTGVYWRGLSQLARLDVSGCKSLEYVPESLGGFS